MGMLHRAFNYSSNGQLYDKEISNIWSLCKKNGYPNKFIATIIDKFHQRNKAPTPESIQSIPNTDIFYLTLPYIGKASIKFSKRIVALFRTRLDSELNIKTAFQTFKTSTYFNLKFPIPLLFAPNVVYQYTCSCDKNTSYIGMTNRQFFVRIEDHISLSNLTNSAVKSHIIHCRPCRESMPVTKNFTVLKTCRSDAETELIEALSIKRLKPNLNIKLGYSLGAKERLCVFR